MKQLNLIKIISFCFLCAMLVACAKEVMILDKKLEIGSSEMIQSARKYFYAHIDPTAPSIVQYGSLPAYWDAARTLQIADGSTKVFVPAVDWNIGNPDMTFKRFLLFDIKNGRINSGGIIEFLGNKYDVHLHADLLMQHYNQDSIPNFNGSIFQYDPSYRHKSGVKYENGVKKADTEVFLRTSTSEDLLKLFNTPVTSP